MFMTLFIYHNVVASKRKMKESTILERKKKESKE
jgi:hypothetical protein